MHQKLALRRTRRIRRRSAPPVKADPTRLILDWQEQNPDCGAIELAIKAREFREQAGLSEGRERQ